MPTIEGVVSLSICSIKGRICFKKIFIRGTFHFIDSLLLAEAYINLDQYDKAAEAINVVRKRANVDEIAASDVDIDYLLDERARELFGEEMRRFTLVRTNKLVERTKKLNPESANYIESHNVLWPVPQAVIDSNTGKKWTNNPGY